MKTQMIHEEKGEKTYVLIFAAGDEVISNLTTFARETSCRQPFYGHRRISRGDPGLF